MHNNGEMNDVEEILKPKLIVRESSLRFPNKTPDKSKR